MTRILGFSLVFAAMALMVADTAEARFGRRRCRSNNCCAAPCQSGCAPQGMAYNGQDPNMAPHGAVPSGPQSNSTFYRGNPDQQFDGQGRPLNNQGQPRTAPPRPSANPPVAVEQDD